jgi:hypothetical protein
MDEYQQLKKLKLFSGSLKLTLSIVFLNLMGLMRGSNKLEVFCLCLTDRDHSKIC